jgi:hypothetical protein
MSFTRRGVHRAVAPVALIVVSVLATTAASTLAIAGPNTGFLDANVGSRVPVDYSADEVALKIPPLSPEIIDAIREDRERSTADPGIPAGPAGQTPGPGAGQTPKPSTGVKATPTPTPTPQPTPTLPVPTPSLPVPTPTLPPLPTLPPVPTLPPLPTMPPIPTLPPLPTLPPVPTLPPLP